MRVISLILLLCCTLTPAPVLAEVADKVPSALQNWGITLLLLVFMSLFSRTTNWLFGTSVMLVFFYHLYTLWDVFYCAVGQYGTFLTPGLLSVDIDNIKERLSYMP